MNAKKLNKLLAHYANLQPRILVGETFYPISAELNLDHKNKTACINVSQPESPYRTNLPKGSSLARQMDAIPGGYKILVHLEPLKNEPHDIHVYPSEGRLVVQPMSKTTHNEESRTDTLTIYGIADKMEQIISRYMAKKTGVLIIEPLGQRRANCYSPSLDLHKPVHATGTHAPATQTTEGHGQPSTEKAPEPIVFDMIETVVPSESVLNFKKLLTAIIEFDPKLANSPAAFKTGKGQKMAVDVYEIEDNDRTCSAVAIELEAEEQEGHNSP